MGRRTPGADDYVICADEKTSIQARIRKHATAPPCSGKPMRVEHEYTRGGAWTYLAAWDVHRAKIFGRCEAKSGIKPFDRLVDQVMSQIPYKTVNRVFWIIDNGSSHRGQPFTERHRRDGQMLLLFLYQSMPVGLTKLKSILPLFRKKL